MKAVTFSNAPSTELLERLSGARIGSDRLQEIVAAYLPILEEISRLQELDLHDIHPAVIFEPTAPYRRN